MKQYCEMNNYDLYELGKKDGLVGNNKVKEIISSLPLTLKKNTLYNRVTNYIYGYKVGMLERKLDNNEISFGEYSDSILKEDATKEASKLLKKVTR